LPIANCQLRLSPFNSQSAAEPMGSARQKAKPRRAAASEPGSERVSICNAQLMISPFLFWSLALLTLIFGASVVVNRNPVASALSLVVSFLGLAALFMSLDAFFVGIIQVLVYAGAVMVLFLFIIMLLNVRAEVGRRINWLASAGGITVALALLVQIFLVIDRFQPAAKAFPPLPRLPIDDVRNIGALLFSNYNLPLQIVGVLVLVATVGVVLLSKRELR
jgi:NADH-quinone oxidoreductase subunit J